MKVYRARRYFVIALVASLVLLTLTLRRNAQAPQEASEYAQKSIDLYNQGRYQEGIPYAEKALEIAENTLGKDPPDVATCLNLLAGGYDKFGDYAKAEPLYKRALDIQEKALGKDHPDVAMILNNLAGLYQEHGDYSKAEPLYKRAIEIIEKAFGKDHLSVAQGLNNLAVLYSYLGDYNSAEPLYKRSLSIREKAFGSDHPSVAESVDNLAALYRFFGDYTKAEPLCQRALKIREKALDKDHPDLALSLDNLAKLYQALGDYTKAELLYKRALDIREKALSKGHPDVAKSLSNLAVLYYSLGDYAKAEPLLKRSLEINEKAFGKDHPDVAMILNNLAGLYQALGDYTKAKLLYKRSLEIAENTLVKDHRKVFLDINRIAYLFLAIGQVDEAYRVFKNDTTGMGLGSYYLAKKEYIEAEKQFQKSLDIDLNKEIKIPHWIITDHIGLGRSFEGQGRYKEATAQFQKAIELIESQWRALNASARRNFLSGEAGGNFKRLDAYDGMVRVLLKEKGASYGQESLQYAERVKSRLFLEQLANRGAEGSRTQDKAVLAKDSKLHQEVAILRARLTRIEELGNRAPAGEVQQVSTEFNKAAARYEAFINQEKMKGGEVASLIEAPVFDVGKLQKMLDADTAVLEYYTAADCTYAWVITRSSIKTAEIPIGNKQMLEAVNQFRLASIPNKTRRPAPVITIAASGNDTTEEQRQKSRQLFTSMAEQFYKELIAPLEKDITAHKLIIVPHGGLHKIPFCSLNDGKQCLIDKYAITVLPAASVAQYLEKKGNKDKGRFFALSNPTTAYAPPLVFAEAEVKAIEKLFKEKQVYERAAATKAAAMDNSSGASILHFACHGEFNDMQPMQSGLLLAPDPKGENDGVLQVHEIFGMNLPGASLVTLSACETALGKIQGGDDLVGLSRGFIYAGTPSLLATLWAVDDRATGELMESFYENWQKKGMSKPEALRQAQQSLRQKPEYSDPFYWAGFEMIGDWK